MALDLTLLSRTDLDKFIYVQSLISRQNIEAAKVRVLRDYYSGEFPTLLSLRQEEFIGKLLTEGEFSFGHNVTRSIIDTLRERLSVSGFTVNGKAISDNGDDAGPEASISALMWAWWEENRYDAQQIRLHRRALRDGKSYVMVDYDQVNGRPRFTLHSVDDGTTGITCHRDPEMPDRVLYACKYFYTFDLMGKPGSTGRERKTVYLPHEIRKYIRGGTGYQWIPTQDPEDNGVWPLPWVDRQGKALGIPVIEFENPGGSEVAQIIGLQNLLNKSWLDLIAAADQAGFPILAIEDAAPESFADAVAASEEDDDIEGDDELFMAPGRILDLKGARAHRIESGDMSQLISVIRLTIQAISGVSKTPQHDLWPIGGSEIPSGEALKTMASGIVKRAEERQLIFGQAWADVMVMGHKLERTFGDTTLPDIPKLKVKTVWVNAEIRNELTDSQTAEAHKRLGVPEERLWQMLGYSPPEIAKFKATQRSDQAAAVATIAGAIQRQQTQSVPVAAGRQNGANGNGAVE